jgi:hypothetical protein
MRTLWQVLGVLCVVLLANLGVSQAQPDSVLCPESLAPRLWAGGQGRVTPGGANNVRDIPSRGGQKVGELAAGTSFRVLSEPVCGDGLAWYEVEADGLRGWTVESVGGTYALEPVSSAESLPRLLQTVGQSYRIAREGVVFGLYDRVLCEGRRSRLTVGRPAVQALDTDPLRVRQAPAGEPTGEQITPNELVWVVSQPQCVEGVVWWQVSRNLAPLSPVGWVAEYGASDWFFEAVSYTGPYPVEVLADGTLAEPAPSLSELCVVQNEVGLPMYSQPIASAVALGALDGGRYRADGVYYAANDPLPWLRIVPSEAGLAEGVYWVKATADTRSSEGCNIVERVFIDEAVLAGIECLITFEQQTNLRAAPDGNTPRVSFTFPATYPASEQFERQGEGFRWWRIAADTPFDVANLWVREDFVKEEGDCDQLPVFGR